MHADALLLNDADDSIRSFTLFIVCSIIFHVAIFVIVVYAPSVLPHRNRQPSVINVDLVSLGAPAAKPAQPAPPPVQQAKKETPVSESRNVAPKATQKKSITIGTKKRKKSLKKKPAKKEPVSSTKSVDQAIADMRKKVEADEAKALQRRMSQLASQVKTDGRGGYGSQRGRGGATSDIMNIYKAEILFHIEKNWSVLDNLIKGQKDLEVKIGIKIMPDGEIRDMWFDKRSGNAYFDEQAEKAVKKTKRLPPLPEGFSEPFLNQGLRFTPQGIN